MSKSSRARFKCEDLHRISAADPDHWFSRMNPQLRDAAVNHVLNCNACRNLVREMAKRDEPLTPKQVVALRRIRMCDLLENQHRPESRAELSKILGTKLSGKDRVTFNDLFGALK